MNSQNQGFCSEIIQEPIPGVIGQKFIHPAGCNCSLCVAHRGRVNPEAITLVLPYPPSVNTYWRHLSKGPLAGRTLISERGRNFRNAVEETLLVERIRKAPDGNLSVTIEARMPDKRKRDLDNIPKAVLDALTHCGFWIDDSLIDDLRVWRSDRMGGEVIVTVEPFVRVGRLL
jgi:crossover junction endodeoxyribonuclease RusA